jgi:hypothetical protein
MWFSREHFELCNELKSNGVEPRFRVGDLVARGFADLGYEEFQILPGPKILSLTAGTVKELPADHIHHFFWIPSIDDLVKMVEQHGARDVVCSRVDQRTWGVKASHAGAQRNVEAKSLFEGLARLLLVLKQSPTL